MNGCRAGRRILMVVSVLGWSGAETQLLHLAAGLSRRGHTVTVLAIRKVTTDVTSLHEAGVEVVALGASGRLGKLQAVGHIVRYARRADMVHCTGWDASLWGRCGAIAARRPVVVTEHTPGRDMQVTRGGASRGRVIALHNKLLDRWTYATVAVAAWQVDLLASEGVLRRTIVHIPNGVPVQELRRRGAAGGTSRTKLGIPEDAFLIAHVARFASQKGQPATLRAISRLREDIGDVRVIFVGEGAEEEAVRRQAAAMEAEWAMFLGRREDVPALFRISDLAVLPSAAEGLPMSLIEALAVGTPVVATDVGDVRWLLESSGGGICVASGDEEAFTRACRRVLADSVFRQRLSTAAVQGADEFDAERMTDRYQNVFEAAITGAPLSAVAVEPGLSS